MKHLFEDWKNISEALRARCIFLFLDYDGTLTPIVNRPEEAILPEETRRVLENLSKRNRRRIAIVSGRRLSDLKGLVGLEGLIYVGNHGLEILDSNKKFQWIMPADFRENLAEIKDRLIKNFANFAGIFIEDKELTLSLHYRLADIDEVEIKAIFDRIVTPYQAEGKIAVVSGKKVLEIRPVEGWHKGKIVLWLFTRERFSVRDGKVMPIYVGDDTTDEDAFKELNDQGLTVMVGKNMEFNSSAKYYLDNTDQVVEFLKRILNLKNI